MVYAEYHTCLLYCLGGYREIVVPRVPPCTTPGSCWSRLGLCIVDRSHPPSLPSTLDPSSIAYPMTQLLPYLCCPAHPTGKLANIATWHRRPDQRQSRVRVQYTCTWQFSKSKNCKITCKSTQPSERSPHTTMSMITSNDGLINRVFLDVYRHMPACTGHS
jgi:hypothetical protein